LETDAHARTSLRSPSSAILSTKPSFSDKSTIEGVPGHPSRREFVLTTPDDTEGPVESRG